MPVLERPTDVHRSTSPTSFPRPLRVLCIDDDPHVVNALERNLESRGAEVLVAYHGMQGYWLACTESPDVIITDISMPHGNGDYVVECLKRNTQTRSIPVIVLSGLGVSRLERDLRNVDVERVFTKPAPFASLYREICSLV